MSKLKFGSIVVDGRGKIGGHVLSKNRGGSYLRTKVTPVNGRSDGQLSVRNRFTGFSQGWRGLTEDQRAAWSAAVADFARTDIFGDLKNPSGSNLYQRLNNILAQIGEDSISVPPIPSEVSQVVLSSIAVSTGDGSIECTFAPTVPAGCTVIVRATPALSAGKMYVKNQMRIIQTLAAATATGADIATAWVAKFGTIPAAGSKISVQFLPVNLATGQIGSPSQASAVIGA
jgi:hypothetical protein